MAMIETKVEDLRPGMWVDLGDGKIDTEDDDALKAMLDDIYMTVLSPPQENELDTRVCVFGYKEDDYQVFTFTAGTLVMASPTDIDRSPIIQETP